MQKNVKEIMESFILKTKTEMVEIISKGKKCDSCNHCGMHGYPETDICKHPSRSHLKNEKFYCMDVGYSCSLHSHLS